MTDEKTKEYVNKLQAMVPSFNWTNADLGEFKHGTNCPAETVD